MNNTEEGKSLKECGAPVFSQPCVAVDIVIFTIFNEQLHVLTVERSSLPYKGYWSLVGGYIDIYQDKNLEETAKRKLEEKTGVKAPYLEQFETIGNATRDPRGWSITTVYFALIPCDSIELKAGKGSDSIKWSKIENGKIKDSLPFDHAEILLRCTERLRNKVLYTSLPIYLMPRDFTLGELQKVYEIIIGKKIDHKSFRRRILGVDILEDTERTRQDGKKPAKLYQLKEIHKTHFFMRNIEAATEFS